MTTPTPDAAAILAALPVLFTQDDVIELRAFPKGRKRTDAGYFDGQHWPQLAEHAARLSTSGAAVYVTLNPVDPQLLSRYSNRIEGYASTTTTDKQVTRRRWLLIDIDPVRPSGTSATDAQLDAAKVKARAVYGYLNGIGWPAPLVAESGNGMHLLYALDLPNDDDATALVKAVLIALGIPLLLPFYLLELWHGEVFALSPTNLAAIAYTAVFASLFAYLAWNYGIKVLGASRVGLSNYLMPVFAATLSWLLLDEALQGFHWAGATLIFSGLLLANWKTARKSLV